MSAVACLPCPSLLCSSLQRLFALQDKVTPATFRTATFLADTAFKIFHPAFLISSSISVEINDFAIRESDSESFFNEHVAFFLLCETRLATLSTLARCLLLCKSTAVINQLGCIRKIDGCSRLACRLMECCELASRKLEVATTPILETVSR